MLLTYTGEKRKRGLHGVAYAPCISNATMDGLGANCRYLGVSAFTHYVGGDVLMRSGGCCIVQQRELEVVETKVDKHTTRYEYRTKYGSLYEERRYGEISEHRVKNIKDFDCLKWILDDQTHLIDYGYAEHMEEMIGEHGIAAPTANPSPVQDFLQFEMGVAGFAYNLFDHPREMEQLMEAKHEKMKEMYEAMAASPAQVIMACENTSTTMISPDIYQRYSMKHMKDFADIVHKHNKTAMVHMCGLVHDILPFFKETGADGIDALCPPPMGDTEYDYAFSVLGDDVVILGSIHPSLWVNVPKSEVEANIKVFLTDDLLDRNFVFCIGADGRSDVSLERFNMVGEIMQDYMF